MKKITLLVAFIAITTICQSQNSTKTNSKEKPTQNNTPKTDKDYNRDVSLTLFPNPTTNFLNITTINKIEQVDIYNLLGQKVMTGHSNIIDVSSLSKGIYFSNIQLENKKKFTIKFIKG